MCTSKDDGGRRCQITATARARRTLSARRERLSRAGRPTDELDDQIAALDAARALYGPVVTPMNLAVPRDVAALIDKINDHELLAVVVGGSVRDAVTGISPKDFDIEVYGTTIDKLARVLRASGYHVDEVGKAFGVLKTRTPGGEDLDISVPRRDSLAGAGHRGVAVEADATMTVAEASERRDFTMNALMWDQQHQVCIDPHGGRADIDAKVLRHVSDAFADDPLRPLRGFQFAARQGMTMAPETTALCASLRPRAGELPVERIRGEWMKFYEKGTDPGAGLRVLRHIGWNDTVPGLASVNADEALGERMMLAQAIADRDGLRGADRVHLMAGVMAERMDASDRSGFMRFTVEGQDLGRAALGLASAHISDTTATGVRCFARDLSAARTSIMFWARRVEASGDPKLIAEATRVVTLARSLGVADGPRSDILLGRHLLGSTTQKPGPWMGEALRAARAAQDAGEFDDIDGALHWLKTDYGAE